MTKTSVIALALAGVSATATSVAFAGQKATANVFIDTVNRRASGALGSARNSADARQLIGCQTEANSAGAERGQCTAVNAAGITVRCTTTVAAIIDVMQSVSGDSHVVFHWNQDGTCRAVTVGNFSHFEPKKP